MLEMFSNDELSLDRFLFPTFFLTSVFPFHMISLLALMKQQPVWALSFATRKMECKNRSYVGDRIN